MRNILLTFVMIGIGACSAVEPNSQSVSKNVTLSLHCLTKFSVTESSYADVGSCNENDTKIAILVQSIGPK